MTKVTDRDMMQSATFVLMESQPKRFRGVAFVFGQKDFIEAKIWPTMILSKRVKSLWQVIVFKPSDLLTLCVKNYSQFTLRPFHGFFVLKASPVWRRSACCFSLIFWSISLSRMYFYVFLSKSIFHASLFSSSFVHLFFCKSHIWCICFCGLRAFLFNPLQVALGKWEMLKKDDRLHLPSKGRLLTCWLIISWDVEPLMIAQQCSSMIEIQQGKSIKIYSYT